MVRIGFIVLLSCSLGMFVQWLGMWIGGVEVGWWSVVPALSLMLFSIIVLEKLRGEDLRSGRYRPHVSSDPDCACRMCRRRKLQ